MFRIVNISQPIKTAVIDSSVASNCRPNLVSNKLWDSAVAEERKNMIVQSLESYLTPDRLTGNLENRWSIDSDFSVIRETSKEKKIKWVRHTCRTHLMYSCTYLHLFIWYSCYTTLTLRDILTCSVDSDLSAARVLHFVFCFLLLRLRFVTVQINWTAARSCLLSAKISHLESFSR